MKIKSVFIENYKALKNFNIDFYSDSKESVTVICGLNGSGKTTLLNFIYEVFEKQNITLANKGSKIKIREENLFADRQFSEDNVFDLTSNFLKKEKKNFKIKLSEKLIYYKANIANEAVGEQIITFLDELIYEKDTKSSFAYQKLRDYLNQILESLNMEVEFDSLDKNKDIYFRNKGSEKSDKIKLKDLSDGEKEVITKLFSLYISEVKNSVILIDEPECSLHPNWQNEIMHLYQTFAEKNNNQLIIATHSPHIVSAVRQEQLKILIKEADSIKVVDSSSPSYGRKINEILIDIFRVNGLRTPKIERKMKNLEDLAEKNKYKTPQFSALLSELENDIGKFDPDLAMIRMEVRRKEGAK